MLKETFQEQLKEIRLRNGLTQDELGEILGISGQMIYKYEKGTSEPSLEMLEKILIYFDIDANLLLGYSDNNNTDIIQLVDFLNRRKKFNRFISKELSEDNSQEIVYAELVRKYPFLEGHDIKLLLEFDSFTESSTLKELIDKVIN